MQKATKAQLKKVKELLRDKKARDDAGFFVVEGEKIIRDALIKDSLPLEVFISSSFEGSISGDLVSKGVGLYTASEHDMEKVSSLDNSQGILAIFKKRDHHIQDIIDGGNRLLVLADGVQDPGNMGTLLRSSAAFGAGGVLLMGDAVDIYNPKVVRASGGAVLDMSVIAIDLSDLEKLKKHGYSVLASSVSGDESKTLGEMSSSSKKVILAFGSEGRGLSEDVIEAADEYFYIPIDDKMESLNVTIAASIALYVFREKARG